MGAGKKSKEMSFPVIFRASIFYNLYLLLLGLFWFGLFKVLSSAGAKEDWYAIACAYIFLLGALVSFVIFLHRIFRPTVFKLYEDGIELRHSGFVHWDDVKKLNLLRLPIISFEFKSQSIHVPFYIRLLKGIYENKGDTVKLGFYSKGLNTSSTEIRNILAKVYTAYVCSKNNIDPDCIHEFEQEHPEKAKRLLNEIQLALFSR